MPDEHERPEVQITDADRALMRVRQRLSALSIEVRVGDTCPQCGLHMIMDEAARLQLFLDGGSATCRHCGITKTIQPAQVTR